MISTTVKIRVHLYMHTVLMVCTRTLTDFAVICGIGAFTFGGESVVASRAGHKALFHGAVAVKSLLAR